VEGVLPVDPGHRSRLGSDPPLQAVAQTDVSNSNFSLDPGETACPPSQEIPARRPGAVASISILLGMNSPSPATRLRRG
jgi:hypothetical protein